MHIFLGCCLEGTTYKIGAKAAILTIGLLGIYKPGIDNSEFLVLRSFGEAF